VFCAGANIFMLGQSSHAFKVNFCRFTNETRLAIEDASAHSGIGFLAGLNGTCAGGGYELALACDEIVLVDDGNAAVSLPEAALLGVLPGTGGLTRVVDKRRVRRDLADVFSTLVEGIKGKRAVEWRLVDRKFNRQIGMYAGFHFDPKGVPLPSEEWERRKHEWLPSAADASYLLSIMAEAVYEPGRFANYIAAPRRGINRMPIDFEYVRTEQ
jgi:enoyl-CoA hydratase/carnithine racemase